MHVAVLGGGINGLCSAWALLESGHRVTVFERGDLMRATSQASSKLLHGGLRYLEHGEFRLVREALGERRWWLDHVPELAHPLCLIIPFNRESRRARAWVKLGLWLYDRLAGRANIARHQWLDREALCALAPGLQASGLRGGYAFYDGQMDDYRLGMWVAEQVRSLGGTIHQHCAARRVGADGRVDTDIGTVRFDAVVNAAGPWSEALLATSAIPSRHRLDLIRGSHLLLDVPSEVGFLLEAGDGRPFFVLPYQGRTLVGTTEVRQGLDETVECSDAEAAYLLDAYNRYFTPSAGVADVCGRFAGLRPLVSGGDDPQAVTRDYALEIHGRLLSVFGGKWTTARALGRAVARTVATLSPPH